MNNVRSTKLKKKKKKQKRKRNRRKHLSKQTLGVKKSSGEVLKIFPFVD